MRLLTISLCFLFLAGCNSADQKPAEKKMESRHSAALKQSLDAVMNDYYAMTETFVKWDSNGVDAKIVDLEKSLKAVSLEDLKNDTTSYTTAQETLKNSHAAVIEIAKSQGLEARRRSFHALTQNIYDLLRAVKYDEKKLYLQECPMAFNDTESGFWLTDKGADSIRNPYLGLHHPKYGKSMIECGSNKSTIDFQK